MASVYATERDWDAGTIHDHINDMSGLSGQADFGRQDIAGAHRDNRQGWRGGKGHEAIDHLINRAIAPYYDNPIEAICLLRNECGMSGSIGVENGETAPGLIEPFQSRPIQSAAALASGRIMNDQKFQVWDRTVKRASRRPDIKAIRLW